MSKLKDIHDLLGLFGSLAFGWSLGVLFNITIWKWLVY